MSLAGAMPEVTFMMFRKRLRHAGHALTLCDSTVKHLREKNLILKEGSTVDATIIEAPFSTSVGTISTDLAAGKRSKHGRAYYGFKALMATDKQGLIKDYAFDTASSSDH